MGGVNSGANPYGAQIKYKMQPFMFWLWLAAMLPHVSEIPVWVITAAATIGLWAWLALHQKIRPMSQVLLGLFALLSAALTFREFHTLLGPDAATPLLLLLASLKLHEIHKRRDVVIFLFITLLCVMYYLLQSQTLLATVYMIAMTLTIAVCFIVIHTPPEKLRDVLRASPRLVGKDMLLALPIFLAFFFLFPRFSTPWGQFIGKPQTSTGFSDTLHPGDMVKLARSQDPAFRVSFTINKHPNLSELYWRGTVLDRTNGWNWLRAQHETTLATPIDLSAASLEYKITLEAKYDKALFSLDQTPELHWVHEDHRNPIRRQSDNVFQSQWPNFVRVQYQGLLPQTHEKETLDQEEVEFYTRLPSNYSDKARTLAERLTIGAETPEEKSDRIMNYFSDNGFQYSLSTPQMDTLDKFLFEDKTGFCEHFASAYASLMRAAGVPARVIMGFQGGEYNEFSDYLLVRDSQAHAWAEIYSAQNGWERRDPTGAVSTSRILLGSNDALGNSRRDLFSKAFYSTQMFWDSMNNRYTQFLMNYDFGEQKNMFGLGANLSIKRYQFFLALILLTSIIFYLTQKFMRRSSKKTDMATTLYNELCARLARRGVIRGESEGPLHFARRAIAKIPANETKLGDLFTRAINWRYHDLVPSRSETVEFRKILRAI